MTLIELHGARLRRSEVWPTEDMYGLPVLLADGEVGILQKRHHSEDRSWITALRAPQVKVLVRDGALQLSLFDEVDLAEITSPDYPGERLVACKNPFLEAERARKRESLLQATETDLEKIAAAVQRERRPLRGQGKIALRRAKSPSTSPPASPTTASDTPATRTPSPPKPPSTASTCCAPPSPAPTAWEAARWSPLTRRSPRSSGRSGPSTPTWTSGPSATAPRPGSARMCSCGCCRTTSPGTCTTASRPLLFTDDDKPAAQAARRPGCPLPASTGQSRAGHGAPAAGRARRAPGHRQ
jgi:hypothetical protein